MLSNRPDVKNAEYSLAQAFYNTAGARSAFYPALSLSGTLGWTTTEVLRRLDPAKWIFNAAASLVQPIFNAGRNQAQLRIAKAQQQEALLSFPADPAQRWSRSEQCLAKCQSARSKVDLRQKQVASLETAVESTQLLMRHGSTTYLEVLTAQQTLLSAQLSQITTASRRFGYRRSLPTLWAAAVSRTRNEQIAMKRRVTREDIIRTTRDLIIRDGIRAVRVDEIAQKLEISKRTLYELFSDKDTLVGECWDKIREEQEKKIAGYLFYQPGSALEQAQNLIREYIDALCMISCISLQELQQKVSYADSYEKNRRFWLDSFTEVLEHCIADNSVLPDVDCPLFAKQLMNMLLNLYLEGGTRQEMDAFGWAFLRGIATHRGIEWLDGKKPNS